MSIPITTSGDHGGQHDGVAIVRLRYEGMDADRHQVNMRTLGQSLVGFDTLVNSGLIVASYGRLPKRGERFQYESSVRGLHAGSVEVLTEILLTRGLLDIVTASIAGVISEIAVHYVAGVLKMRGGKMSEVDPNVRYMLDHMKGERQANHEFILKAMELQARHAKAMVTPIGRTCEMMRLSSDAYSSEIDKPMADAVRSKEPLEVGAMEEMTLKFDGFAHHDKSVKVERPDSPGRYMSADVRDPVFKLPGNVYLLAASKKESLTVSAKVSRKPDGTIYRIYIMDAHDGS